MGAQDENPRSRLLSAKEEGMATMQIEWGDGGKSFATDTAGPSTAICSRPPLLTELTRGTDASAAATREALACVVEEQKGAKQADLAAAAAAPAAFSVFAVLVHA